MVEINSQVSMISFFGASYWFPVLWCESWLGFQRVIALLHATIPHMKLFTRVSMLTIVTVLV